MYKWLKIYYSLYNLTLKNKYTSKALTANLNLHDAKHQTGIWWSHSILNNTDFKFKQIKLSVLWSLSSLLNSGTAVTRPDLAPGVRDILWQMTDNPITTGNSSLWSDRMSIRRGSLGRMFSLRIALLSYQSPVRMTRMFNTSNCRTGLVLRNSSMIWGDVSCNSALYYIHVYYIHVTHVTHVTHVSCMCH